MKSRYIRKADRDRTDRESCFKCAWCGVPLKERHHIYEYSMGGSNTADNLILLCPNCHTEAHKGRISREELEGRKIGLNGVIDRSSGCLSIQGEPIFVAGGTKFCGGIERIVVHNDIDYLRIEHENGSLLVSLKVFDSKGYLVCWMSRNRWWVDNESIFEFISKKSSFEVFYDSVGCLLSINIMRDRVELRSRMYIDGNIFEFDERTTKIGKTSSSGNVFEIGKIYGNKNSIAFKV